MGAGVSRSSTLAGEVLSARGVTGGPAPFRLIETYLTRVQSWWAMVALPRPRGVDRARAAVVARVFLRRGLGFAALREMVTYHDEDPRRFTCRWPWPSSLVLPLQYVFVGFGMQSLFGTFIPVYAFLLLPVVSALRGASQRVPRPGVGDAMGADDSGLLPEPRPGPDDARDPRPRGARRLSDSSSSSSACRAATSSSTASVAGWAGCRWRRAFRPRPARASLRASLAPQLIRRRAGLGHAVRSGRRNGDGRGGLGGGAWPEASSSPRSKRDRGVKDWSHLIPGQGGFMDQLDSAIFAAPVFFHLTGQIWPSERIEFSAGLQGAWGGPGLRAGSSACGAGAAPSGESRGLSPFTLGIFRARKGGTER